MPYLTLVTVQLTKFPPENVSTTSSSHLTDIYSNIFFFYRKITQLGFLYRQQLFLSLQLESNSLLKTEDLEDLPLTNICKHWKSKEFQLIDYKKIISCVLPMVVITVPAKKKELPKSQWLIWADVFPKGMIPAFIAATTCCKFKKIFVNIHETIVFIYITQ